ncbi:endoglucanase 16-like [Durio zibethinus]|uniref:cellulase n=1 Tax=Durio zibethinus TaxID=66656 RepID=A0A6P5ZML4_DURZI|nr:endoglucanase 16-like [Durio zibethinus]
MECPQLPPWHGRLLLIVASCLFAGELGSVRAPIHRGTDYFLKAPSRRKRVSVQVDDPVKDHEHWVRPENMKKPRTVLQINESTLGTEIAAQTSATMAASYTSTHKPTHVEYITEEAVSAVLDEFNWDLKYAGIQVLSQGYQALKSYKDQADSYICSVLPQSLYYKFPITPGGLKYDSLERWSQPSVCRWSFFPFQYLWKNPLGRSFMVVFENNPPKQTHHRGASVPLLDAMSDVSRPMSFVRSSDVNWRYSWLTLCCCRPGTAYLPF